MFRTLSNPATTTFAWVGAAEAEVVFLTDFRWSPKIILWHDLLLLLEGQEVHCGRRGGLMVSALDSGVSGPGLSPGRGHCVVFLGKTLYSHSASLHSGV